MIHLNIGLDANGRPVNPLTVLARFVPGLDVLADLRIVESSTEPALVVSLHALESIRPHDIAIEFAQDCIAVYDDETGEGSLAGPRAAKWGPFDPQAFYMTDGRTLAAHQFDASLVPGNLTFERVRPETADCWGPGY